MTSLLGFFAVVLLIAFLAVAWVVGRMLQTLDRLAKMDENLAAAFEHHERHLPVYQRGWHGLGKPL